MSVIDELIRIQPAREMVLTVGVFDGVHPGHQYLISKLKEKSKEKGLLSGVVTFSWHPKALLAPQAELPYLTSLEERIKLIKDMGVDHVIVLSFTSELAQLTARKFVGLLKENLKMRGLMIGPDFALGQGREGNADMLRSLGQELGFAVEVIPPVMMGGRIISSTAIRQALAKGDVDNVTKMLGRHFQLSGTVVHGDHRGGDLLGFPTANLSVMSNHALPADGGYVTLAHVNDTVYRSVTNIGVRPTFGPNERAVETYILDFDGDLYGHELSIEFVRRLRGEIKFETLDKLKAQIESDVATARAMPIE